MPGERASERKDDHLRLAAAQQDEGPRRNGWDDVRFVHHALAGVDAERVDLSIEVAGSRWALPMYVNAMTGGSSTTGAVNRSLAVAAAETGIAIASGSLSIALDNPELMPTFRVIRDENPEGFVMANVGIERSPEDARRAVDALDADALQVHVNAVQETVMPEGSRSFSSWPASLEAIVAAAEVPVIVKEVGFGLSGATLRRLADLGVAYADVSGTGGTDFVRIENERRPGRDYAYLEGWGQSAVESLLDAPVGGPVLLASGGVRTPLDVARGLALGARAVGASGSFLAVALDGGADALVRRIREWSDHLRALHSLVGATAPDALRDTDLIVRGRAAEYARARGLDIDSLARRAGGKDAR